MTTLPANPIPIAVAKPKDDAVGLQRQISALAKTGGTLNLNGSFQLGSPLILPRTGPFPTTAVRITNGALAGLPTFPASRGMIEWATPDTDTNANQAWGQRISDVTFTLPNVPHVRAIKYTTFNANSTPDQVSNEWLQLFLENISINCHNDFHDVLIDLTNCRFATWRNISADPDYGDGKGYDTLLIKTPQHGVTGLLSDDSLGLVEMHLSGLTANRMRGGACRTFDGRAYLTTMEDSQDVGGHYAPSIGGVAAPNTTTPIAFHFTDSVLVTLRNICAEPKGSAFLRLDNCTSFQVEQISSGTPPTFGMVAQDAVALYGCRNVKIRGRFADPGTASLSQFGVAILRMDAGCIDCVAEDFDVAVVGGVDANARAGNEIKIDPGSVGSKASGFALQAWSPNVDAAGEIVPYRQAFSIGN